MPTLAKTAARKSPPRSKAGARRVAVAQRSRRVPAPDSQGRSAGASSKRARLLAKLESPAGATIAAMVNETGWQPHTVRGFLAGVVRKKLKFNLQSRVLDGQRVYRIEGKAPQSGKRKA